MILILHHLMNLSQVTEYHRPSSLAHAPAPRRHMNLPSVKWRAPGNVFPVFPVFSSRIVKDILKYDDWVGKGSKDGMPVQCTKIVEYLCYRSNAFFTAYSEVKATV